MTNEQYGTDEWRRARLGWLTASRIADATAKLKSGGYGASRANLMAALICERLTDVPMESFTTKEMQWGIDHEPEAIAAYSWHFDVEVQPTGFVRHPRIDYCGATPDGAVGDDGLIEIKCPNTSTHVDTLLRGAPDPRYIKQMQFQMACTGRKWVDFVTYDPRMPLELQFRAYRVPRDDKMIAELESEAEKFLAEMDEKIRALRELCQAA